MTTQILQALLEASLLAPELRFCQLISVITGGANIFYLSDEYFLNLIEEFKAKQEAAR